MFAINRLLIEKAICILRVVFIAWWESKRQLSENKSMA